MHHWVQAGIYRWESQQIERSPVLSESCRKECLDKSAAVCSMGLDSDSYCFFLNRANVRTALHGKKLTVWA